VAAMEAPWREGGCGQPGCALSVSEADTERRRREAELVRGGGVRPWRHEAEASGGRDQQ